MFLEELEKQISLIPLNVDKDLEEDAHKGEVHKEFGQRKRRKTSQPLEERSPTPSVLSIVRRDKSASSMSDGDD